MATPPLAGIRIVDLSRVLAGPLATMTLGDLGANVIKVERAGTGDETRSWGPPFDPRGESAYYLSINRNKISVAVDLDSPEDVDLLCALIRGADAVVDNFRPGTLERRGVSIDRLLTESPELVWCTITGFGPDSARPGYDFVVQAESGWMAITGEPLGEPMKVGVALADVIAGKDATTAVLAGLAARGRGRVAAERRTFVSLAGSAVAALVNVAQNALVSGVDAKRWGNAHANLVPYELFRAADRPIVIAVGSDAQWRACAEALGLPQLASDARLATNAGRLANRELVVGAMRERVATRPAQRWLDALAAVGVPAGIVRSVPEALTDVHASPLTGVPPNAPGVVRLPPPMLDEHGTLVRQHGWDAFARLTQAEPAIDGEVDRGNHHGNPHPRRRDLASEHRGE
jgi:crotonobetainyl-CoA:carnitine CoA-transferase CaiB-like acyl-CoA transferase